MGRSWLAVLLVLLGVAGLGEALRLWLGGGLGLGGGGRLSARPRALATQHQLHAGNVHGRSLQPLACSAATVPVKPKTPRVDWRDLVGLKAMLRAKMLELWPERGGYPMIAPDCTQEQHDKAIQERRDYCAKNGLQFQDSHVKVPFVNEVNDTKLIALGHVWSGNTQHLTPAMIEDGYERQRAFNPKGTNKHQIIEIEAIDELATIGVVKIIHLDEGCRFDMAIDDSASGSVAAALAYVQVSVASMEQRGGKVLFSKSIAEIKRYLDEDGAVFLVVRVGGKIDCAYVLLPSDLPAFERATSGMNGSRLFQPSPFCSRKLRGLSAVMSKYRVDRDGIKGKIEEHIRTGPRETIAVLNSQVHSNKKKELEYLVPFLKRLGNDSVRIREPPGDVRIFGIVNVEFKKARLDHKETNLYKVGIRRNARSQTDFDQVRAFCFVVEVEPQRFAYVFVPTLTADGTSAFAPKDGYPPHRLVLCFYYDKDDKSFPFYPRQEQYDRSCLADVLVLEDIEPEKAAGWPRLEAFARMCQERPAMDAAERERALHIPPEVQKREQGVKIAGRNRWKMKRKAADDAQV